MLHPHATVLHDRYMRPCCGAVPHAQPFRQRPCLCLPAAALPARCCVSDPRGASYAVCDLPLARESTGDTGHANAAVPPHFPASGVWNWFATPPRWPRPLRERERARWWKHSSRHVHHTGRPCVCAYGTYAYAWHDVRRCADPIISVTTRRGCKRCPVERLRVGPDVGESAWVSLHRSDVCVGAWARRPQPPTGAPPSTPKFRNERTTVERVGAPPLPV